MLLYDWHDLVSKNGSTISTIPSDHFPIHCNNKICFQTIKFVFKQMISQILKWIVHTDKFFVLFCSVLFCFFGWRQLLFSPADPRMAGGLLWARNNCQLLPWIMPWYLNCKRVYLYGCKLCRAKSLQDRKTAASGQVFLPFSVRCMFYSSHFCCNYIFLDSAVI